MPGAELKRLGLTLLLSSQLTGCFLTMGFDETKFKFQVTPDEPAAGIAIACPDWVKPMSWSSRDTLETQESARDHNAGFKVNCPERIQ